MIDAHWTLAEKFLKKGFWLYFFGFIIAPIGYIVKIIVSNDLSVSEVGILYGVISLITLLSAFSDFWIRESLSYFIPRFEQKKETHHIKLLLVFWFIMQLCTGVIIFSLFFFGADIIALNYFQSNTASEILKIFAFFFLGINLFQLINSFFLAVQNTFLQKLMEFIRMGFVMLGIILIYFWDFWTLLNYSYAWIGGLYIWVCVSLVIFYSRYYKKYLSHSPLQYNASLLKEIFIYASVTFFSVQSFFILSQIDMQMVLYMLWAGDAWYYTNYLSLVSIPNIILGPIFLLLYPIISELHAKNENHKIQKIKHIFQKHFLVISLAFSTLFFVFSIQIAYVFFGEKFIISGLIMQYAILFISWNFLLRVNHIILAATGRAKTRLYIVLISIAINVLANYILILQIWVAGAALGTGISWIAVWALTEYVLKGHRTGFDRHYLGKNILFCISLGLIMYIFLLPYFEGLSRWNSTLWLFLVSSVFFLLFTFYNYKEVQLFLREINKLRNHS